MLLNFINILKASNVVNADQHNFTTGARFGVNIQENLSQEGGQTLSRPSACNTKTKVQAPKVMHEKDESVVNDLCCTGQVACILRHG